MTMKNNEGTTHWEGCYKEHHECAIAQVERLEEELHQTRLHVREKIWVDAAPDAGLVKRILSAYIDDTTDTDNLLGLEPENFLCIEMNKARAERNQILRGALAVSGSADE